MKRKWWEQMFFPMGIVRYIDEPGPGDPPPGDPPPGDPPPAPLDVSTLQGDAWATIQNSDAFKENTFLRNTKSFEDMVTQATNAQTLIGQDRLPMPKDDWTEDQWKAHYDRLGRPEAPDKFELPEGVELDKDLLGTINPELHTLGLTQNQYKGTMKLFTDTMGKLEEAHKQAEEQKFAQAETELKQKYGDQYDGKVAKANALINEFGNPELKELLVESGLGNNPRLVDMLINVAEQFADDTAIGESRNSTLSPVNKAKAEIANLKSDDAFRKRLFDESHPGHKEAVQKWQDLHKQAFPSK